MVLGKTQISKGVLNMNLVVVVVVVVIAVIAITAIVIKKRKK